MADAETIKVRPNDFGISLPHLAFSKLPRRGISFQNQLKCIPLSPFMEEIL
jgi:hypothetical protein